jgi:hypothetical protein
MDFYKYFRRIKEELYERELNTQNITKLAT